ncbi:MAG: hypothetical protein H7X95_06290 [Deltaproteobacteria bacterium]|nr:hypothetical protein [Deltaproteobacteria bacterium]
MRLPSSAHRLRFDADGKILFALNGPEHDEQFASLDWQRSAIEVMGKFPGSDVRNVIEFGNGFVLAVRKLRKDLWVDGANGRIAITSDGNSDHGWLSSKGDLVVQRRLAGGRYVVVVRDAGGHERQMTEGPIDVAPTFSPDGGTWMYTNVPKGELIECDLSGLRCETIHQDSLVPGLASFSPSGQRVAYLTLLNSPRIRVISSRGGEQQDLGPVGSDSCGPFWASDQYLWVAQSRRSSELTWVEMSSETGQLTGRSLPVRLDENQDCAIPASLGGRHAQVQGRAALSVVSREESDIAKMRRVAKAQ